MNTLIAIILYLCIFPKYTSSESIPIKSESHERNIIIDLNACFSKSQTVCLSEIADSVTFVPFETTKQSLMAEGQKYMTFSIPYIFYNGKCFDWNGKFYGTIVKKGQGQYEEFDGGALVYNENHFYSKGSKFIEYDMNGKPTGKMKNLFATREFQANDFLRNGTSFTSVGNYFMVYDYPGTIYFFNKNFEMVSSRVVIHDDLSSSKANAPSDCKFATFYQDTTIFYNFSNDTIFHVSDTTLKPRWIVKFDHPLRLSNQVLREEKNYFPDLAKAFNSGSSVENIDYIKKTDHKHRVLSIYETEKQVFFLMKEILLMAELRKKTTPSPYIVIYDKKTDQVIRVKGNGFVDDLLGMDFFYPQLGVFDQKMISYIWPHELFDYIEECTKQKREVSPKLLSLSKKVDVEDNPILILIHLK